MWLSILGVIVFVSLLTWLSPHLFAGPLHTLGRPLFALRAGVGNATYSVTSYLSTQGHLVRENKELKEQLALLEAIRLERERYKAENEQMSALLGTIPDDKKLIAGRILTKPGFSPYDTVIIDGGQKNGMHVGDAVLADNAVVVGYLSAVGKNTATVSLYSSPEQKRDVFIGVDALQATAVGKGAGNFEVRMPRNAGIAVGDIVSLASSTDKILGSVEVINTSPTDSFEKILFRAPVDVTRLTFLLVDVNSTP
jgi:cell shape-determining protein MreC